MRVLFILLVSFVTGCGPLEWTKSDTEALCKANPAQCQPRPEPTVEPEPLVFSGYIQRAFPITVDGIQFNDAEDLYTRFIDEFLLVDPVFTENYGQAEVEVEGEYGIDRFGSGARVFVLAEDQGIAAEEVVDREGGFRIQVGSIEGEREEEEYRARVVIRIGLRIKLAGGEQPSELHFCYLLSSIRENLLLGELVIFDDFTTQLTKYGCEQREQSRLLLPTPTSIPTPTPTPSTKKVEITVELPPLPTE